MKNMIILIMILMGSCDKGSGGQAPLQKGIEDQVLYTHFDSLYKEIKDNPTYIKIFNALVDEYIYKGSEGEEGDDKKIIKKEGQMVVVPESGIVDFIFMRFIDKVNKDAIRNNGERSTLNEVDYGIMSIADAENSAKVKASLTELKNKIKTKEITIEDLLIIIDQQKNLVIKECKESKDYIKYLLYLIVYEYLLKT